MEIVAVVEILSPLFIYTNFGTPLALVANKLCI
nr:MAG TPA: hypothetical protein [Crassvirales sp.]